MKKLLILAYDFPPYVSVGGLRPYSWLKYLKEFDVEPIVVTRQWSNDYGNGLDYIAPGKSAETIIEKSEYGTVIRTPFKPTLSNRLLLKYGEGKWRLVRKALTAFNEISQFIWISGPKKQLYYGAKEFLKENKVDSIVATGDPFVLFSFANKLSKRFDIPWIADYRDPWSKDKGLQQNFLLKRWNQYLEKKIVKNANYITTASPFFKEMLHQLFATKRIDVLTNGYDSDTIDRIALLPQSTSKLTIAFIGTIYKWHPWKSFIEQFSLFLENNPEAEMQLNLYGINIPEEVTEFIQQFPIKTNNSIALFPRIPNIELLERIGQENAMLLYNYYSFMGTKIYDYLGIKRKILMCYSNDKKALELKDEFYHFSNEIDYKGQPQIDLINETNAGIIVENEGHLKSVFQDLVNEFKEKGKIECNSIGVENFSRKIQAKKLQEIVFLLTTRKKEK